MDKDEIIEQLQEVIAQLKHDNELLLARIRELEAQLAKYENPHTPPSLRRGGGNTKKNQNKNGRKKPGQKKGNKGVTRERAELDDQIDLTLNQCPYCDAEPGNPSKIDSKDIDEILEPQPVIVTRRYFRCDP